MSIFIIDSCLLCGQPSNNSISLCHICKNNLPKINSRDIKDNSAIKLEPKHWDDLYTFFHYEKGVKKLIQSFKFGKNHIAGDILKQVLYIEILNNIKLENKFDIIIPMPIHKRRNFIRGFNQAYILSQYISSKYGVQVDSNYVHRSRHTKFQNKLSTADRQKNISNVFKIKQIKGYHHVLIIDDIITTGNSINELAKTLKKSGVNTITVCALAISQG